MARLLPLPWLPSLLLATVAMALCACRVEVITEIDTADLARPRNLAYSDPMPVYVVGQEATPNLPSYDGLAARFSVDPELPTGLILDPDLGIVSGVPLVGTAPMDHVVTARNAFGEATSILRVTVQANRAGLAFLPCEGGVQVFHVRNQDGALLPRNVTRFGQGRTAAAVQPDGRFLHLVLTDEQRLLTSRVSDSGALEATTEVPVGREVRELVVHPSGQFVYAVHGRDGFARRYLLDERTGSLVNPLQVGLGADVSELTFDQTGRVAAVVDAFSFLVAVFLVDLQSGLLRPLTVLATRGGEKVLAYDPVRGRLAVALLQTGELWLFRLESENGLPQLELRTTLPGLPSALAFHWQDGNLMVADRSRSRVSQFAIMDNQLALRGEAMLASPPVALVVDHGLSVYATVVTGQVALLPLQAAGSFGAPSYFAGNDARGALLLRPGAGRRLQTSAVYVASGDGRLHHFEADSAGFPRLLSEVVLGAGLRGVAMDTEQDTLHVVGTRQNFRFTIGPGGGLAEVPGANLLQGWPVPPLTDPVAVAASADGRFFYAACAGTDRVGVFLGVGNLLHSVVDVVVQPRAMAVDPAGRFVAVVSASPSTLTLLRNDPDGTLRVADMARTGSDPRAVAITPNGRFLYTANTASDTVSAFVVGNDLRMALLGPRPVLRQPQALAVDPTGRFLLVASGADASVVVHRILADGRLEDGRRHPTPADPVAITFLPGVDLVLVACRSGDRLVAMRFDANLGSLVPVLEQALPAPTAVAPRSQIVPGR